VAPVSRSGPRCAACSGPAAAVYHHGHVAQQHAARARCVADKPGGNARPPAARHVCRPCPLQVGRLPGRICVMHAVGRSPETWPIISSPLNIASRAGPHTLPCSVAVVEAEGLGREGPAAARLRALARQLRGGRAVAAVALAERRVQPHRRLQRQHFALPLVALPFFPKLKLTPSCAAACQSCQPSHLATHHERTATCLTHANHATNQASSACARCHRSRSAAANLPGAVPEQRLDTRSRRPCCRAGRHGRLALQQRRRRACEARSYSWTGRATRPARGCGRDRSQGGHANASKRLYHDFQNQKLVLPACHHFG